MHLFAKAKLFECAYVYGLFFTCKKGILQQVDRVIHIPNPLCNIFRKKEDNIFDLIAQNRISFEYVSTCYTNARWKT